MPAALVTGITGFVGSEVARQLLVKGYHVKAIVRHPTSSDKIVQLKADLLKAAPAGSHLDFLEGDVRSAAVLESALAGCDYAFHAASPFLIEVADPQADLIDPAVLGTRAVLQGAAAHKDTLKRVVVTSSMCAIHDCHQTQPRQGALYTEADWNTVSTLEKEPYWLSKVLGEKEAWALAPKLGLHVVTILPNFVMGPVVSPAAATSLSIGFMKAFLEAPEGKVPSGEWTFSDVRDVAAAHVAAAEHPEAEGRYIVSFTHSVGARHITDVLKKHIPHLDIPDGADAPQKSSVDGTRLEKHLGLHYHALDQTLADMADSLIAHGIAKPKLKAA